MSGEGEYVFQSRKVGAAARGIGVPCLKYPHELRE